MSATQMTQNGRELLVESLRRALNLPDDFAEWEFKEASLALPKSIWDSVSAFANTSGGWIALGVAERSERIPDEAFDVVGISDPKKVMNDFVSQIDDVLNVPFGSQVQVQALEYQDKWLVIVRVDEAPRGLKPVYDKRRSAIAGGFKRVGGSDLHLTDADVERMYRERDRQMPDAQPVETVSLVELRPESVETYRELLRQREPASRTLSYDQAGLLRAIGATTTRDTHIAPTVAGVLVFGDDEVVQREFPTFWVDIIDIPGTRWVPDYATRFDAYPPYRGSLLTVHTEVLRRLRQDLPATFALDPETLSRRDDPPLLVAMREAFRNALIHQDYAARRPTQIRRYEDRIEIENPGYSLKPVERLGEPGSELRNPSIARIFGDMGWSEQKGSGIRAIQQAMEAAGLTPPVFQSDPLQNTFQATFFRHHFMSEDDLAWLQEHTQGYSLSDAQKKALVMALRFGRVDNPTYCQINHTDTLTASRELRQLRDLGFLLQSQPKGPGTHYLPAQVLPSAPPTLFTGTTVERAIKPVKKTVKKTGMKPVKKPSRRSSEDVRAEIVRSCSSRPCSAVELAADLDMNRIYLVEKYLGPMVRQGVLAHTVPHAPRARNQRYVIVPTEARPKGEPTR